MKKIPAINKHTVVNKIYFIRGKKVMLDRDLAELYKASTGVLNQAVRRNKNRFPVDFMFRLTKNELQDWISQIVISNKEKKGIRNLPYAFTEQGVAMLSSVLRSQIAIKVNIRIIRIFTQLREMMNNNKEILFKLKILESKITNQDHRLGKHNEEIEVIFRTLKQLINPPKKKRKRIGFKP